MALTPEQFEKLKSRLSTQTSPLEKSGGSGFSSNVRNAFNSRDENVRRSAQEAREGNQTTASAILQSAGQAAGFAGDVGIEAIKAITPDTVEKGVSAVTKDIVSAEPIQKAFLAYQKLKDSNPEEIKNLEAVLNIASILPTAQAGKAAGLAANTGTKAVAKTAMGSAGKVAGVAGDVIRPAAVKVAEIVDPIEEGTKAILNPTNLIPKNKLKDIPIESLTSQAENRLSKFDRYTKIAEQAAKDYSKPTPLVIAGQKGTEALNVLNNKLSKQGLLKQEALGKVGDKLVVGLPKLRAKLRDDLRSKIGVNLTIKNVDGKRKLSIESAPGRASKIAFDPADNKLITDTYRVLAQLGEKPSVRQIDDTVDALQDLLYKRKSAVAIPVNGQVEGVIKSITGTLNNNVKKVAGEQYTKANKKFAYFIDTRDKLNKALGEEGVRGGTLLKQLFSPSGEAPRRLFGEIKKLTGIDLTEEATLAKFAMENAGDARQASLLEETIRSGAVTPKSFIANAAKTILKKTTNKTKRARGIITKRR